LDNRLKRVRVLRIGNNVEEMGIEKEDGIETKMG